MLFFLKNIQTVKGNDWYSLKTNYDKFKELDEIQPKNKNYDLGRFASCDVELLDPRRWHK